MAAANSGAPCGCGKNQIELWGRGILESAASRAANFSVMDLDEFDYELPQSLIAAFPTGERERSRLLVLRRASGEILHSFFSELGTFLDPGYLLVLNDTKVFPARLRCRK